MTLETWKCKLTMRKNFQLYSCIPREIAEAQSLMIFKTGLDKTLANVPQGILAHWQRDGVE